MLFLGHIGITAGVVRAGSILGSLASPGNSYNSGSSLNSGRVISSGRWYLRRLLSGIKIRLGSIDYRIVVLGSLLPDIIDKPIWLFVGSSLSLSGRDYAHTLLFNLILFIVGLVLIRVGKTWLLVISISSFAHIIFDQMWNCPIVLLWPLLGPLPEKETTGWLSKPLRALFSQPEVYIPEIIGVLIILLLVCRLVKKKNVTSFIKAGVIG